MDSVNIHASCVLLAQAGHPFGLYYSGVLLLGPSGAGKSDLALRLIDRGGLLVSDDRTDLTVRDDRLFASVPSTLAGLIEVRGVGIIKLSYERQAQIAMVVELVAPDAVPRMPEPARFLPPAPLVLSEASCPPLIRINALEASAQAKVLWGVFALTPNPVHDAIKNL
ncbi:MAG TPA: HPr kinase/phosphatase C-terminal domain-containing protein [Rhizomicrobium sp.]|nr:HPr kinase/phosphatase C-terminal domain-containing protein [Rhizomicrobium sp.]